MEKKILTAFLYNNKLKFNEMEKFLKTRSNKLAFHLKKLVQKGVLQKEKDSYKLSENSEILIPYIKDEQSILPVILILIKKQHKVFLIKRSKRPYKDKLSLPGGRILLGENIHQSVKRIMKEKFNIDAKLKKINSISFEHIKKNSKIIHSFLLILVTVTSTNKLNFTEVNKNKNKIIESDYLLIRADANKKISIANINSKI